MIRFGCPTCDKTMKVEARHAGRKVSCPRCGEKFRVPADQPPASRESAPDESAPAGPAADGDALAWEQYDAERREARRGGRVDEDELDMTPMVDVTFLLLIFFMITASFQFQQSLPASAPEPEQQAAASAANDEEPDQEPVVVEVAADGRVFVDGRDIPLPEVAEALTQLKAEDPDVELLLEVDREALHGTVVAVTDAAATAGITAVKRTSVGG